MFGPVVFKRNLGCIHGTEWLIFLATNYRHTQHTECQQCLPPGLIVHYSLLSTSVLHLLLYLDGLYRALPVEICTPLWKTLPVVFHSTGSVIYFCLEVTLPVWKVININPLRTACQLVKRKFLSFIEPVGKDVRKIISCESLMHHFQRFVIIGSPNECFTILTL